MIITAKEITTVAEARAELRAILREETRSRPQKARVLREERCKLQAALDPRAVSRQLKSETEADAIDQARRAREVRLLWADQA